MAKTYKVTASNLVGFDRGQTVTEDDIPDSYASVELLVKSGILTEVDSGRKPAGKEAK